MSKDSEDQAQREVQRELDSFYRLYWAGLVRRLRKVFGAGPPEPEDLAQEAFARIAGMENPSCIEAPGAFLFRTALNLGFNASQRQRTAKAYVDEVLSTSGASFLEDLSPEDVFTSRERIQIVAAASGRLTEKQRAILSRARIHGETYAQISAATGWSQADISRQLNTALAIIQDSLREAEK